MYWEVVEIGKNKSLLSDVLGLEVVEIGRNNSLLILGCGGNKQK